ncbi:MAG: class I SAM-dependent methyltransferase [Alphaproteobacteria bacterium]
MATAAKPSWNPLLQVRDAYSRQARAKRAQMFRDIFSQLTDERVLDLGGGKGDHIASVLPGYRNVTVADYNKAELEYAHRTHGYDYVIMDGAEGLPFKDKEYDIIYSNSVIEHVTGPKDVVVAMRDRKAFETMAWTHQKAFAEEIRRVGKGYFVQTPYKWFIVESHTITPNIVQVFPRPLQIACYRAVPKKRSILDFYLLTIEQMQALFPDADLVYERSFGMIKSIIAVKRP